MHPGSQIPSDIADTYLRQMIDSNRFSWGDLGFYSRNLVFFCGGLWTGLIVNLVGLVAIRKPSLVNLWE